MKPPLNFNRTGRPLRITSTESFQTRIDFAPYVYLSVNCDGMVALNCRMCGARLIRLGGQLGTAINQLDAMVILAHAGAHSGIVR